MKHLISISGLTVLLAVATSALSQNVVVISNYMKIRPGMEQDYLSVEQQWKEVHRKTIDEGIKTGWQLWRKLYTGTEDAYEYITLDWFVDFASTLDPYPASVLEGLYSDKEWNKLMERTENSRDLVRRQVSHQILAASNSSGAKYMVINRMHVEEADVNNYVAIEDDIWRPYHEVCIEAGFRTYWGLWREWPFEEGQSIFTTVDGFDSPGQIMSGEDLLSKVHPDMTWDGIDEKTSQTRRIASVEIWELVDFVFREE